MALIEVGQRAPSFRLPSGQGPERGLDEFRGRSHVIVWFTKGMGCPFCRSQMSQLARGYERIRSLGADVLQITPTTPGRAAFYVRNFTLPFVYLCDPDYSVHRQWGVAGRAHSPGWYAQRLSLEKDPEARAIMQNAQQEEFKHFGMDLEFLLRRTPKWRTVLKDILFKPGDIVEHGEKAEKDID